MARRSPSKSLKNHPGNNLSNSDRTLATLGWCSGCKLWIWFCEYLIRRLRRQNNNTPAKLILIRGRAKLFAEPLQSGEHSHSPPLLPPLPLACPQTKTAIYCKITWLKKDWAEGAGEAANRIHFGHAPFRAKFMARGSGWNYKRAFAEALMRSPKEAEQPGRARTHLLWGWNCSKCDTSLTARQLGQSHFD